MYGLVCGLVTKSVDNALYISNSLRAGTIWVNCFGAGCPHSPFGGFKVRNSNSLSVLIIKIEIPQNLLFDY